MIALGLLHVLFTFHDYDEFSLRALWFASAGIAIILAGFLNIALLRNSGQDQVIRWLSIGTNVFFAILFLSALLLLSQPQVFFGAALFMVASATGMLQK
jgi:hypothetical protein